MNIIQGLVVSAAVVYVVSAAGCDKTTVTTAESTCLNRMELLRNTTINATAADYTRICLLFMDYLVCMENNSIDDCSSDLIVNYEAVKKEYMSKPYKCKASGSGASYTSMSALLISFAIVVAAHTF